MAFCSVQKEKEERKMGNSVTKLQTATYAAALWSLTIMVMNMTANLPISEEDGVTVVKKLYLHGVDFVEGPILEADVRR